MKYIILKYVNTYIGYHFRPIMVNEDEPSERLAIFDTKQEAVDLIAKWRTDLPYDSTLYTIMEVYNA